jgi:hypothetical protein
VIAVVLTGGGPGPFVARTDADGAVYVRCGEPQVTIRCSIDEARQLAEAVAHAVFEAGDR